MSLTPDAWEPPTLREIGARMTKVHIRRQVWMTFAMCLAISASVVAQGTGESAKGWLDQLTAPTTLLALITVIYQIGMTRQQLADLKDRSLAHDRFITETLPNTYVRKDSTAASRIIHHDEG